MKLHMDCKRGKNYLRKPRHQPQTPKGRSQQNLNHGWGKLISCNSELSVCTTDINTAKLNWKNAVSMDKAQYMCLKKNSSLPPSNTSSTCASPWIISPVGLSSNIIFLNMHTKNTYTSKCTKSCGDSHRHESWHTNISGKNCPFWLFW